MADPVQQQHQHQRPPPAAAAAAAVRNRLLAALPPGVLASLRPALEPVGLRLHARLYAAGGRVDAVHFVEAGMVSMLGTLEDGGRIEVGLVGREGLVGLPLVLGDGRATVAAEVQMAGSALRIGAAAFRDAMDADAALRAPLLRGALAFHAQVAQTAMCNGRHTVGRRLARWLLAAHDRAEADAFPMTHEFLSSMLGARRPGVSEAARRLQQAGAIHYARGRVAVLDRRALERAACGCYAAQREACERLLGPPEAADGGAARRRRRAAV